MGAPRTQTVAFETDADGDAVEHAQSERGSLVHVVYIPDATDTPAAGTTLTAEGAVTGIKALDTVNVGVTRKEYSPRVQTHDTDGAEILYEAGGSVASEPLRLAKERLKLTIASGGDTKKGVVVLVFE